MSSLTPFIYQDHPVRVVTIDGEPWFVLADLCKVIDLTNPTVVANRLEVDDLSQAEVIDSMGRSQVARTVSETGMYDVVVRSDSPAAKPFRRWVTHEVLPQIRRTGAYSTAPQLSGKELLAAALLEADQVMKQQAATIDTQRAELAAAAPKVHAWDGIISGAGDYTITDAAKVLARAGVATGPRKLHQQMLELGWLYKNQRDKWTAKQAHVNDGCLAERARYYTDEDGVSTLATPQVRITAKGLGKLRALLVPQSALSEEIAA